MSIYSKNNTILINHKDYLNNIYKNVYENGSNTTMSFRISPMLFCIVSDNKHRSLKRNHDYNDVHENTKMLKEELNNFNLGISESIKNELLTWNVSNASIVRDFAKTTFQNVNFDHIGVSGTNDSANCLKCVVKDESFLIPPLSRFICGDVAEGCRKLKGEKFDILIADPPWWNKFIRRVKAANNKLSYNMMYNEDIASIPVQHLLSDNCLIAVWCTNAPSNITAIKELIFPKWGIQYRATWFWIKVKTNLEPICAFSGGSRKQPYERVLLGSKGNVGEIPEKVLVSVPSALHSHKPPLIDVLKSFIAVEDPKTVELFARYLFPNTTSIGYEPLKWQHMSLFECIS